MTTYTDPPPSPSTQSTAPQSGIPPAPEPEKKPARKLETPVLVAIISAGVTLITSLLGSPVLLSMINRPDQTAPTPMAGPAISQNSLLPADPRGAALLEATFTPAEGGATLIEFTATPQKEDPTSAAPILESPFPPVSLPSQTPDPPTPAAPSFFDCLSPDLWFPYPAALKPEISAGCWNLAGWGFSTDQGRLALVHNPGKNEERGIYTPVPGDADIRFNVELKTFRLRSNKGGFLNFGIVQNDPLQVYTGGFLSYQQPSAGPASPVRVLVSGKNQATQKISVLEAGFRHEVLFSISDDLLTVYLNGEQAGDPVKLPPTERAFWIGYVLPSKGELDVTISDFTIQTR